MVISLVTDKDTGAEVVIEGPGPSGKVGVWLS